MNANVIEPKQRRSQETQRKLLKALNDCLKDKFFEHISIQELADCAGVSVGTYYRRFKNKEALLPLLYQDFGQDLIAWIDELVEQQFSSLEDAVCAMVEQTKMFLQSRKSVFRTLHLNSRLYPEFITVSTMGTRREEYQRMANILLRFESQMTVNNPHSAANMVIHTLVNGLMDKVLYPELTPAIASELSLDGYAKELPTMLIKYLR
ncbi:TetR/AcrR family transcriptional regulator [Flocculibacter collagenilyticus]|uniref:TetR/AcrR family transcriptional regulator n=1 Tax=Flocculibacter collagenilyticus TaxID=2744479 RepID=UPI0018F66685|nr:TetR/AcrR family transcriptional regulator [Flocculibacter collagenilyticus]